ncbi:peptidase [Thiothrix subterranea]|uniref:vWA domain-containing protein n=1 Tax=Thiothrix subterranea TaxID=2735563 RepID=UPI00192BB8E2|nr:hypothetical protein [Thiothrix subterranea]QQZ28042.1 peptidase [Thiothrix subterranea]
MATPKHNTAKYAKHRQTISEALAVLVAHPLFKRLLPLALHDASKPLADTCWGQLDESGGRMVFHLNVQKRLEVEEWVYIIALGYLHLGLGHVRPGNREWRIACELYAHHFARQIGIGKLPTMFRFVPLDNLPLRGEQELAHYFQNLDDLEPYVGLGIGGFEPSWKLRTSQTVNYTPDSSRHEAFVAGLNAAVQAAVATASNEIRAFSLLSDNLRQANHWVINSFPLLSALASSFSLHEDKALCERMHIAVAAIHPELREVYINPHWKFSKEELIFILLHEYLHIGLRHDVREQGRDAYYWNVACDYVINGWLVEMQVGKLPAVGILHDPELAGRSAEDIYDEIVSNLRWQRKLEKIRTLRGEGKSDIINERPPTWWTLGSGVTLDEFYRRCMREGLEYAQAHGRGLFPAGLVEEIRAINQRPIPWDVQLTEWLDQFFPPVEKQRSYARISRRQSATPDIPRPHWHRPEQAAMRRTFGVVLDTSGSMSRRDLGMALGAISAYAMSRDVTHVRLVFCDATPYDAGYVEADYLLDKVEVKGRGGTVLQPAVDLLQQADNFPKRGPLLIITDGYIDELHIRLEHAYLMPTGSRLPFKTQSPVFYFESKRGN